MNKKRYLALFLALVMAVSMLAGCSGNTEKTPEPEPSQEQQEQQEQTTPEKPEEKEPEQEKPQPEPEKTGTEDEPQPEEQTPSEEEPELTEEQKRLLLIEQRVNDSAIWGADAAYDNTLAEEAIKGNLVRFLNENWDNVPLGVSGYFEADDFRMNLYQNSFEEYICVLSRTDSFEERYIRVDPSSASAFSPNTNAAEAGVSADISALVDGAKFDRRYDGYYFDDKMDAEKNKTFRAYAEQALSSFKKTLEENKTAWKTVLDDAFRVTVSFDENDQFVLELQGKSSYWLELRYVPGRGVWSDVGLIMQSEEDWTPEESKLTDGYLLSLVEPLEIGMTAAPFTFESPSELSQQQLWLLYLLLTPEHVKEAAYQKTDRMYHITQADMTDTLSKYFKRYQLKLSEDSQYDEKSGEIVTPLVSGFGGDRLTKLRDKKVDGNTVTFTAEYYGADDVIFKTLETAKTYTITFYYGGYFYDSAVQAAE